jgi:hypothetical protein
MTYCLITHNVFKFQSRLSSITQLKSVSQSHLLLFYSLKTHTPSPRYGRTNYNSASTHHQTQQPYHLRRHPHTLPASTQQPNTSTPPHLKSATLQTHFIAAAPMASFQAQRNAAAEASVRRLTSAGCRTKLVHVQAARDGWGRRRRRK